MSLTIDEAVHQILAAAITAEVIGVMDKIVGSNPVYHLTRPLLVSSLLYSAYKSVRVGYEPEVKA